MPKASPELATVSIALETGVSPCGAGWLLPNGMVLTCNHVVKGKDEVWVRYNSPTPRKYLVRERMPRRQTSDTPPAETGDLALLVPAAEEQPWTSASRYLAAAPSGREPVVAFGFPEERPNGRSGDGTVGAVVRGRREVLGPEIPEQKLTQGFSGGPVIAAGAPRVLGLFAATDHESRRGYLIPADEIEAWLRELGEEAAANAAKVPPPESGKRIEAVRRAVFGEEPPTTDYDLRIAVCPPDPGSALPEQTESYDDSHLRPIDFLQKARSSGERAIIYANGGGGKSSFLVQLATELELAAIRFIWLNLKRLRREGDGKLAGILDGDRSARERLLAIAEECAETAVYADLGSPADQVVLVADGLNEVGSYAGRLLRALEDAARITENLSVVASARSTTTVSPEQPTTSRPPARRPAACQG